MTIYQLIRSRAKTLYHEEGQIEIDEDARVSISDGDGAYVEAWVWVPLEKMGHKSPPQGRIHRNSRTGPARK